MLIASIIIFLTSGFIPERPIGRASVFDSIPGLLFTDPRILNEILGTSLKSLDGAFWSIYVEVQFYLVSAISFYFFKDSKLRLIVILYFLYIFTSVTVLLNIQSKILDLANKYLAILGAVHFGWFAIGIYTYIYLQKNN